MTSNDNIATTAEASPQPRRIHYSDVGTLQTTVSFSEFTMACATVPVLLLLAYATFMLLYGRVDDKWAYVAASSVFLIGTIGLLVLAHAISVSPLRLRRNEALEHAMDRLIPSLFDPRCGDRLRRLGRNLAQAGHANSIICLEEFENVHPLQVAFEPIDWEYGGAPPVSDEPGHQVPNVAAYSWLSARLGRSLRFHVGHLIGATLLLLGLFLTMQGVRRGRVVVTPLMVMVLLAALAILLFSVTTSFTGRWRVVPGGLVRFTTVPWGSKFVRVLRRVDSIVIAYQATSADWGLVIADARQSYEIRGSRAEVEFALRALSSPIPPPDPDMLESLA